MEYLAIGDSFRTIAFNYRLGHSTGRSIVLEMQSINKHIKVPFVILGDEAFKKKYLMRPYPDSQIVGVIEKRIFNYRLSRGRRHITRHLESITGI
nr:uncharacterized protein LOC117225087 [Megalopta genalis]